MGNSAAAALVGPSGNRCCRYCNVLHAHVRHCRLWDIPGEDTPVVRYARDLPTTQQKISVLRLAGHGFKKKATAVTTSTGITEEYVSTFYHYFIILLCYLSYFLCYFHYFFYLNCS